ncbi:S1C family serine protease [Haloarchaeobius amylolyticus]|uniref:S1C family serine protease n=1 Tax=Haloarchaeobius amylolyticus TaxID=1198296 RepID=UPI00226EEE8D|nr:trypsin-like peptidase domain-containing protein [Haloarchaeobius amylolyticus]
MTSHDQSYAALYRRTSPAVVSIYPTSGDGLHGAGSGFVYDEAGHVVTNHHVVFGNGHGRGHNRGPEPDAAGPVRLEVRFSRGEWRTATLVGSDPATDLAVLRVDDVPEYVAPLPVAASNPEPGIPVAALGNPMGLDGTISAGIVSGVNRSMPTHEGFTIPDTVQTDAPINPGNSGGPLVTMAGEVVGVNRARQGDNIGFAISPELVHRVVPELVATGHVEHATLHVRTMDVSPTVAEANGLDEPRGVLVVEVREGPASGVLGGCTDTMTIRGRQVPVGGDVITGIDGRELHAHEELVRYLMTEVRPGDTVEVTVRRPAGETTERLVVTDRTNSHEADVGAPDWDGETSGGTRIPLD